MKLGLVLIIISSVIACSSPDQWESENESNQNQEREISPYQKKVKRYQDSMSYVFVSGENKVIPIEQLPGAPPLSFFDPSEDYRVKASFEKIPDGEVFEMKTSTDRLPLYKRFGVLSFELQGEPFQLTLYQSVDHPDYLFCPFKDQTNGKETYGAGRYIDFQLKDTLNPVIDFNYCYNPYCAYNHDYSCPIPPVENHLKTRIEAGVKSWY